MLFFGQLVMAISVAVRAPALSDIIFSPKNF
jgi:hypothetical protein